ncbi:PREDICTED: dystroglycan-like [Priapulus caudatus]|uniref:Dystroglycan 1 n=1 Tax=Priapulus caudatus TaxID=37621 RepID=A0ABM1EWS0_PRICU|nr:PREDICTED: dystroglycan-like [Priapulus caudatus]
MDHSDDYHTAGGSAPGSEVKYSATPFLATGDLYSSRTSEYADVATVAVGGSTVTLGVSTVAQELSAASTVAPPPPETSSISATWAPSPDMTTAGSATWAPSPETTSAGSATWVQLHSSMYDSDDYHTAGGSAPGSEVKYSATPFLATGDLYSPRTSEYADVSTVAVGGSTVASEVLGFESRSDGPQEGASVVFEHARASASAAMATVDVTATVVIAPTSVFPTMEATTTPTTTTPELPSGKKPVPTKPGLNLKPSIKQPLDEITVTAGQLLRLKVPGRTFEDFEDGPTHKLRLELLDSTKKFLPKTKWLQFNQRKQEIYGLPLDDDVGSAEYFLAAYDSGGKVEYDGVKIIVEKRNASAPPNHEFAVRMAVLGADDDYAAFRNNVTLQLLFLDKLAKAFGDPNPGKIQVGSVSKGSVVVAWSNASLPTNTCSEDEISALASRLRSGDGDIPNSQFRDAMSPEFDVESVPPPAKVGACRGNTTEAPPTVPPPVAIPGGEEVAPADAEPTAAPETPVTGRTERRRDDVLLTTVLPAVVIGAMLLLAAIVACLLYRRRRKGKMSDEDEETINKGIPVIFKDELGDTEERAKQPSVMRDEKPPLPQQQPPPEYPRSASTSAASTPASDTKRASPDTIERAPPGDAESPPYNPPPPVAAANNHKKQGPKHTPTHRMPPPYVPP